MPDWIKTAAFQGIDVLPIDVQVSMTGGMPGFTVVGLADKAVAESRDRVRAALAAMGLALPPKRITVNLAPADVVKEGSHYDLPIALAILSAMEVLDRQALVPFLALGELGLDGSIAPVAGVLPAAMAAAAQGLGIICPQACGGEAAWAADQDGGIPVLAPRSVQQLLQHFKDGPALAPPKPEMARAPGPGADMADVKGQHAAKRVLEIAAAGGHALVMTGPPGAGKSMLAARLPGLLPEMTAREALEVSMVHSVAGLLGEGGLIHDRPYRAPHHTTSQVALAGGGHRAKPGEFSLAHRGVLFLDEVPEFARAALEALRQPMETGRVLVARANGHVTYPCRFQLVAAMNPCRCGYLGDPGRACSRAPRCALDYQAKISGPLYDRIDLHIDVPAVSAADLASPPAREGTADIRPRVAAARRRQAERYRDDGILTNAEAEGMPLDRAATPDGPGQALLAEAADRLRLSARGYHRVLRVARTIADLDGRDAVSRPQIAEALNYRRQTPRG